MKPIAYEIKRTLGSKFVILLIVAIIGLSSLIAYESAKSLVPTNNSPSSIQLDVGYYNNSTDLTVVGYPINNLGQPSIGISSMQVSYEYGNTYVNRTLTTPGFFNATFSLNPHFTQVNYSFSYRFIRGFSEHAVGLFTANYTTGYSGLSISVVSDPSNSTINGMNLFYVGPNGSAAPSMTAYFGNITSTEITNESYVTSHYFSSEKISGFHEINVFPVFNGTDYHYSKVRAAIASSSNITMSRPFTSTTEKFIPVSPLFNSLYAPVTQKELQSLVFEGVTSIIGFLLAILAVFEGYLTYGKDRTSGVLESVLKRPVSRGALISSRYAANAISIGVAVVISMFSADAIIHYYLHLYLTTSFDLYFIWSYVVEGLAFLALVYMFAHMVKSQGALLGSAIGLFVVFGLFWTTISDVVLVAFHIGSGTSAYLTTTVAFDFASPTGYSSLFQILFQKSVGGIFGSGTTIVPSDYGVIPAFIILGGLLWIAIPFAISLYLSTKRD